MKSIRALKRNSKKRLMNKEINRKTESCQELRNIVKFNQLRKTQSESDINKIQHSKASPQDLQILAKSMRNLKSVYVNDEVLSTTTNTTLPAVDNRTHFTSSTPIIDNIMQASSFSVISDNDQLKIPIIGYEVMEERSRFTIFKLRIENYERNRFWLILRRFTDFTRLHSKLKSQFPQANLTLPKKKWFGNNFSTNFIDSRIAGLQTFVNTILSDIEMRNSSSVRDFFCLDDPPMFSDSIEENRAIFEAQEETISFLKMQMKAKDDVIMNLQHELRLQKQQNEYLMTLVKPQSSRSSSSNLS